MNSLNRSDRNCPPLRGTVAQPKAKRQGVFQILALLLAIVMPAVAHAQAPPNTEVPQVKKEQDPKANTVPDGKALGMSILGNQEAPKALVIVPWKTSELGNGPSVSTMLDDSRLPIDKEVFMRMLSYYEIRSKTNATAPAPPAPRRKP
jgi:hypothetical protein